MSRKMIGFDLDGVLYNWHMAVYEFLNNTGVETGTFDEFWSGGHKVLNGESFEDYSSIKWHSLCNNPILFDRPEHFTNEVGFLQTLTKEHDVMYITARNQDVERVTKRMLKKYDFPNPEEVIFAKDKTVPVILNGVDLFVEDQIGNCRALKDLTKVLVFEQPWNKEIWSGFDTISSLEEVKNYL